MFSIPLGPVWAEAPDLDALYEQLKNAEPKEAKRIEKEIIRMWGLSGSPAMDLILKRARAALEAGENNAALEHYSALIDHAPGFAEGWHGRATVYFRIGRYGQALSDLEHALALEPRHFGALRGVAVILEDLDRPELAYEAYGHVLAIHPTHEDVTEARKRLENRAVGSSL